MRPFAAGRAGRPTDAPMLTARDASGQAVTRVPSRSSAWRATLANAAA